MQLIAREETAEVEWVVGKAVVGYPAAHLANHLHVIVHSRNDEVRQFYPHTRISHGEDGVEHRLEVPTADVLVDVIAERLQVDIGSVEIG